MKGTDMGMQTTPGTGSQGGAGIVGGQPNLSGPGPQVRAASTLEGDDVVSRQGETLGEISDIMLDVPSGRVAYAVMTFGGVMGVGSKLFAVPWNALTLDADRECFVLDVDKQRLDKAPGFDKDHWPSMADTDWAEQVHAFYQARPYWE